MAIINDKLTEVANRLTSGEASPAIPVRQLLAWVGASTPLDVTDLAEGRDPDDSDRVIQSSADLSFGEYIRLLQNEAVWQKVNLPIDQKQFCRLLERARQIRNDVMHFDPDGVEDDDLEVLRHLASMFQRLKTIGRL